MPRNSGAAGTLSSHHTNYGLIFCVSHPFLTNLQRFFISAGSGPRVVKRPGGGAAVSTSRSAAAAAAPPPPPWRRGALEAKQLNQNSRHSQTNKKKLATFQLCGGRPSPAGPNNDGAAGTLSSHLNNFVLVPRPFLSDRHLRRRHLRRRRRGIRHALLSPRQLSF
jgi:hypothetical protein